MYVHCNLVMLTGAQNIAEAPQNVAGNNGSTVTLNCRWDKTREGAVQWWNNVGTGSGEQMSSNGTFIPPYGPGKYNIDSPTPGQYNLQIGSLTESDIGDYGCSTQLSTPALQYGAHVLRVGECCILGCCYTSYQAIMGLMCHSASYYLMLYT